MNTFRTKIVCTNCIVAHHCKNNNTNVNKTENVMADTESYALQKLTKAVWEELNHRGYCVVDKFHTEEKALAILNEAKSMHAKGEMHNGQLASTLTSKSIRGDLVKWVDGKQKEQKLLHSTCVELMRCFVSSIT